MLDLKTVTKLPNFTALPFAESKPNELQEIQILEGRPRQHGNTLVRVGCAVTNERLRRWCIENKKLTLPLNVIMVEITMGGSNAPICHGAGRAHQTLSDLVREIEYVDVHGKLQTVSNPDHLRAASGCFGLMGVVTRITLELSPMTYALTNPLKMPVVQAVPPPPDMSDDEIPSALRINRTPAQKAQYQAEFEKHAASDFYCEWFWFPYSDYSWVNCWNDTADPEDAVDYPDATHIFLSFAQTFLFNILQNAPLLFTLVDKLGLNFVALTLLSRAVMFALPETPVKTYLPDALHFQRGIQNVRVRDMEVEMPLVAKKDSPSTPDFALVQRAWWDAILKAYAHAEKAPMRFPLEMRIMGGSEVVMAPQRGNKLGTCAIEILTLREGGVDQAAWEGFAQEVLNLWMSYTDPTTGKKLNTRQHWAKEWVAYKVDGRPWAEKMRDEIYKSEISEFKGLLETIGREQGWTLQDLKSRFLNDFFDWFFFEDVNSAGFSTPAKIGGVETKGSAAERDVLKSTSAATVQIAEIQ